MASIPRYAYLLRAMTARRWISTEAEVLSAESAAAIGTPKEEVAVGSRGITDFIVKAKKEGKLIEALEKAVSNGTPIQKWHIIRPINQYRSAKKYKLALQLSEWMNSKKFPANDADRAVRIELLAKAKNLDSAEEYFKLLPESEKTARTYGALLSCYCLPKHSEKACDLFEKMKEENVTSTLNYNNMMKFYLKTGLPEKVPELVKEMEENKIDLDVYTYNLLMNSYGALKDLDAAEGVLEKMTSNNIEIDSFTYGSLATLYVNAGLVEKASSVLGKIAVMKNDLEAFHTLITLNAQVSNLLGVVQAWESLKKAFPKPGNNSYLIILRTLSKLGDLENTEKCFREWESNCKYYDVRLSNVLLELYLERDLIEEAELLYKGILERGVLPSLRTLEFLTSSYTKKSHFDLALKYLDMGVSQAAKLKKKWVLPNETVKSFLKYFEENRGAETTKMFFDCLKLVRCTDATLNDSLLSFNITAQKAQP
ncbi:unnamed protein product [Cuscuta europaea]|uniref:Pentatricopeptide repeat-containing protein n=1 Tax=Cuscuta europaea TaxID=41803 RepID=A0A9P1EHM6_CUSEU|nr:unnamed protein product [Cuscuta europaea]